MKHFSEEAWADFARGIKSETSLEMESHLKSGCSDCTAECALWKQVGTIASQENRYAPPEDLVRMVKQEFSARYQPETSAWVLGKLVFDSLAQPLIVGVRAGAASGRQFVYEAEGLTVDLRLDMQPHSKTICAVGQVQDKGTPRSPGKPIILLWTAKGEPVLETMANEFGEFQLEFEAQDQLRLSIEMAGRRAVRIPLSNLK
jgi:hypothetical protein